MKEVYRAKDILEAHIVVGLLLSREIHSFVSGYYLQGGVGELASHDFVRVWVAEDDLDRTIPVIMEYNGETNQEESLSTEDATLAPSFPR